MLFVFKKIRSQIFFIMIFGLLTMSTQAQIKEIGLPFINNYSRNTYRSGTQNWAITQGPDGIMYFANNDGILVFDGNNWQTHPLPNGSVVRSVAYYDNKLYCGGFDEFGYFDISLEGTFNYVSLAKDLPEEQKNFGEIWGIFSTRNGIIFQSFMKIIIYRNTEISFVDPPSEFGFSYYVNNDLYISDRETGFHILRGTSLEPIFQDADFLRENEVHFIIPTSNNSLFIGTTNKGIFTFNGRELTPWSVAINKTFINEQIYTGIPLPGNQIAIGTIQDGLYVIDHYGNIILHVNRYKGLQNNTILSMFLDRHQNLWLGLDNGIDALEISSPISILNYCYNIETSYTSIVHDGIFYIGTNQGLFAKRFSDLKYQALPEQAFELIKGTMGQVWSLRVIDNTLLCGHNLGTFKIDGFSANKISDSEGGWDYAEVPWNKNKVIGGTYNGLVLYEFDRNKQNQLRERQLISGHNESSKELRFDNENNLWITHGYKGIYKIILNEECSTIVHTELYNARNGLPDLPYSLTEINGEFYIVAEDGLYSYDKGIDYFNKDMEMAEILGEVNGLSKVFEDYLGDLWSFSSDGVSVLRLQEDGSYSKIAIPFNRVKDQYLRSTFENIFVYDPENTFIGSQEGLLHYSSSKQKDFHIPFETIISNIHIFSKTNDSLLFQTQWKSIPVGDLAIPKLAYRYNSISFEFMTPYFEDPGQISYSYRLLNFNDTWSPWSSYAFKEFTNLKEGSYTFDVRAQNTYDAISSPATFEFTITPPKYRSKLAYVLYALFIGFILVSTAIFIKRRIEMARIAEMEKHHKELYEKEQKFIQEARQSEEEIESLKNEKLLSEMRHKDMELANSTMHIIQKNKFLTKVKNDIHDLINKLQLESNKQELRQLVRRIDKDINNDQQWKVFDKHFDEVHQDFSKRLKEKHPTLTPNDLRLCSYLRMNISTKEIAPLMNISIRGVEISRYRLRKKLDLERDANLTEYILSI